MSAAVDDGTAHDIGSLLKREAFGNTIIDYSLTVAVNADDFLAVDPPDGCRVGADGEANSGHLLWAVDDRDGPKQHVGRRLTEILGEIIKVDVVVIRIDSMPGQFRAADRHLVAVVRNKAELVGKVLLLDRRLDGAIGELPANADWFENKPTLQETLGIGCFL